MHNTIMSQAIGNVAMSPLKDADVCRKRSLSTSSSLSSRSEPQSIIEIHISNDNSSSGSSSSKRANLEAETNTKPKAATELQTDGAGVNMQRQQQQQPQQQEQKQQQQLHEQKDLYQQEQQQKQHLQQEQKQQQQQQQLQEQKDQYQQEPKQQQHQQQQEQVQQQQLQEQKEQHHPAQKQQQLQEKEQQQQQQHQQQQQEQMQQQQLHEQEEQHQQEQKQQQYQQQQEQMPQQQNQQQQNQQEQQQQQHQQEQQQQLQKQQQQQPSNIIELSIDELQRDDDYRASCAIFLQHLPCFKLQQSLTLKPIPKCRECRRCDTLPTAAAAAGSSANNSSSSNDDIYCRFYEFRRLQYNKAGDLSVAGFPNPYKEPTSIDLSIWQPDANTAPTAGFMDIQVCRYILLHAGDQFCYLWRQEAEALRLHENPDDTIAWKKAVQGIREICDICDTTLFNYHWTCSKCGFGVCIDCFKDRKEGLQFNKTKRDFEAQRGYDEFQWLLCTNEDDKNKKKKKKHTLPELMLTQIIAGDALNVLGRLLHETRTLWQVPQVCGCLLSKQQMQDDDMQELIQDMIKESQLKQQTSASSLATAQTLRQQQRLEQLHAKKLEFARQNNIDYVPGRVWTKETLGKDPITSAFDNFKHINFLRKGLAGLRRFLPPRAMTLIFSSQLAPGVPHEWLCDGKLLRLTDPVHPDNRVLYQEVWKCGQPVMISEVARSLNLDLWHPQAFCRDFGDKPNDLINCLNGNLVPNQPMRHFWEGFQSIHKRLLDANGKPMLLKLKDWPPGDDFAEILPIRFADLMNGLPMPEYTLRTGNLNIASCLPKMFVPPDLGPKMYNAYGSALQPDKGTTNLHLDISDAINIMVYVGIPTDEDSKPQLAATQRAIALGGCDYITRARCQSPDVLPGALWHIFAARDADKIRDLLNRVTLEKGFRLEPDHDPIHDQNWFLDHKLRARLFKEYGVEGYPIVQCLGDAVFIPAGAPHQVQNLHNCIKVAEDFVSPENITHCYHLTHEFRRLSHAHTNHEDKLQIKNIIYHAIKDCCTILTRALDERIEQEIAKLQGDH